MLSGQEGDELLLEERLGFIPLRIHWRPCHHDVDALLERRASFRAEILGDDAHLGKPLLVMRANALDGVPARRRSSG
jgi:hypothetical protein